MVQNYQERRRYVRIPITLTVKYKKTDGAANAEKEGVSRNISQGGLLIAAEENIPVETVLELSILSPQLEKPITAQAKVVRTEVVEEGKTYQSGVEFSKIAQENLDFIQQYLLTVNLDKILGTAIKEEASDIHLVTDQPPIMRVNGELKHITEKQLNAEEVRGLIYGFLTEQQRKQFEEDLELDLSYANDFGRFRVNILQEKGKLGAAFRYISSQIKTAEELGLPKVIEELAKKPKGLILVTGPTGSGKSTTLAAMIDYINQRRKCMIISLEDPIEYFYKPKESIVRQREIGMDSHSFVNALKHTLRQDVDVILVGEIRDLDSIAIALTAAETGHLVLTTLHTIDAVTTINRIVDVFPANQQQQVKLQLAESLIGIVAQILLPKKDGKGRVAATEVLVSTPAVGNVIRQGTTEQLTNIIQTGANKGMHLMDASLEKLCREGIISKESALSFARDLSRFSALT